jgi:hypothetical protein
MCESAVMQHRATPSLFYTSSGTYRACPGEAMIGFSSIDRHRSLERLLHAFDSLERQDDVSATGFGRRRVNRTGGKTQRRSQRFGCANKWKQVGERHIFKADLNPVDRVPAAAGLHVPPDILYVLGTESGVDQYDGVNQVVVAQPVKRGIESIQLGKFLFDGTETLRNGNGFRKALLNRGVTGQT